VPKELELVSQEVPIELGNSNFTAAVQLRQFLVGIAGKFSNHIGSRIAIRLGRKDWKQNNFWDGKARHD